MPLLPKKRADGPEAGDAAGGGLDAAASEGAGAGAAKP